MLRALLSTTAVALALGNAADLRADGWPAKASVSNAENDGQVSAGRLIGMPVLTEDGERVGTVEDLILDADNRMRGVVVTVGGVFGLGARAVGVAWDRARLQSTPGNGESLVILGVTSADLDTAPTFATEAEADSEENADITEPRRALPEDPPPLIQGGAAAQ